MLLPLWNRARTLGRGSSSLKQLDWIVTIQRNASPPTLIKHVFNPIHPVQQDLCLYPRCPNPAEVTSLKKLSASPTMTYGTMLLEPAMWAG